MPQDKFQQSAYSIRRSTCQYPLVTIGQSIACGGYLLWHSPEMRYQWFVQRQDEKEQAAQ